MKLTYLIDGNPVNFDAAFFKGYRLVLVFTPDAKLHFRLQIACVNELTRSEEKDDEGNDIGPIGRPSATPDLHDGGANLKGGNPGRLMLLNDQGDELLVVEDVKWVAPSDVYVEGLKSVHTFCFALHSVANKWNDPIFADEFVADVGGNATRRLRSDHARNDNLSGWAGLSAGLVGWSVPKDIALVNPDHADHYPEVDGDRPKSILSLSTSGRCISWRTERTNTNSICSLLLNLVGRGDNWMVEFSYAINDRQAVDPRQRLTLGGINQAGGANISAIVYEECWGVLARSFCTRELLENIFPPPNPGGGAAAVNGLDRLFELETDGRLLGDGSRNVQEKTTIVLETDKPWPRP